MHPPPPSRIGTAESALAGALILQAVFAVLLARLGTSGPARPLTLAIDEFQTMATPRMAQLMAEGRKTGARLILASQDLTSFGGSGQRPEVAGAILTNAANLCAFRLGVADAALLSPWFSPGLTPEALMRLPDRVFAARLLQGGSPGPAVLTQS